MLLSVSAVGFLMGAYMDRGKRIAQIVQEACILEVCAPKPGNVNRKHDFSDTSFEDFLLSALAIGPAFEDAAQVSVGQIVARATSDCRRRVQSNTNLGMILLLAPLAKACFYSIEVLGTLCSADIVSIRKNLHGVLHSLNGEDARLAYKAIRTINPGGLDEVSVQDIVGEPAVTLFEAMDLAKERDSIASEYVTDFEITFDTGLPALKNALSHGADFSDAVVHAFLVILSRVPDTLIARKNGLDVSQQVSERAGDVLSGGSVFTPEGKVKIVELDKTLRDDANKLNPGTTADLTTAAVFLALLDEKRLKSC